MNKSPLALIIEDDGIIAEIFSFAIKEADFNPIVIRDGIQAMKTLSAEIPALVLLDLHLPGISGINVLREIRSDPRLADTRVLIVSADTTQSEFLRIQADHIMIKPIGFNALRELALQIRAEIGD
ncbi:MAG: response regulator [Anaerolineales bacterium]|nr:response regulator [Anaerolineales bacterium]